MKTKCRSSVPQDHAVGGFFRGAMLAVVVCTGPLIAADVPIRESGRLAGIYKVSTSSDPLFPATKTTEYFLDFGRGIQTDKLSGNVAVSVRRNPNVRVRIMAWQYFPDRGLIAIGNPYAEGSRNAVARGVWRMKAGANGVLFERGGYQIVLHRADPDDY